MGLINALSDYGSGASMDSLMSPWSSTDQIQWPSSNAPSATPAVQREKRPRPSSYLDLVRGTASTTWDARQEFKANGIDSPYVEDDLLLHQDTPGPSGFGGRYRALRQTSCPERITTSTRPVSWIPSPTAKEFVPQEQHTKEFYKQFLPTTSIDYNYHQNEFKKDFYDNLDVKINSFRFPGLDDQVPGQKEPKNALDVPMEVDFKTVEASMMPEQLTPLATSTPIDYQFTTTPMDYQLKSTPIDYQVTTTPIAPRAIRGADYQSFGKVAETTNEVTSEQLQVLSSLPDFAVEALLRQLSAAREGLAAPPPQAAQTQGARRRSADQECRFCKNNGERESFYRSHCLKDNRGRVVCPILQYYVCDRCGATGTRAHTAKYCPLATTEDRQKSAAMMRSVSNALHRRRHSMYATSNLLYNPSNGNVYNHSQKEYVLFGQPPSDGLPPLDPSWVELEKKLCGLSSS